MDLAIKAGLADATFDEDLTQARRIVGEIRADAAGALENLRALARGISLRAAGRPGLAAALGAQASKSPGPVPVEADGSGGSARTPEAAVYFCCLQALQNTAKYAHASQGPMRLRQAPERF